MAQDEKNKLRTPLFRVAFASVFAKRTYEDGDPKFEITMLFPKDGKDQSDLSGLKSLAQAAAIEKWGADKLPENLRSPFADGDSVKWDGFAGHTFARASTLFRPKIINRESVELMTDDEFYSGCWAYATVDAYAYDVKGNKGVKFGLLSLLFIRDDEPFSSGSSAEEDFADLIEDGSGTEGGASAPAGGSIFD